MDSKGEIVVYQSKNGKIELGVKLENNDVWLTQQQMANLFDTTIPNINMHLSNIYKEGELEKEATIKESLIVQKEGGRQVSRKVSHYNLDAIISLGYRVNSKEGTQFRIWARMILKDHLVNGFTYNEHRIKELERRQDVQDDRYELLRKIVNKYMGEMARKDVLDAVIGELDLTKSDVKLIKEILKIEGQKKGL